jgi:ECF sigma factor
MRRILVDHARSRRADKRGGAWDRITLVEDQVAGGAQEIDLLALHESLERLAAFDPRQERIVELRYFGGLTIEEAAEVVGISEATVVRPRLDDRESVAEGRPVSAGGLDVTGRLARRHGVRSAFHLTIARLNSPRAEAAGSPSMRSDRP